MRINYPLIKVRSGGNVYFERLRDIMTRLDIETEISYYHPAFELAPFLITTHYDDIKNCDIIHSNIDYGFAFNTRDKPLVVTAHHVVFNQLYQTYISIYQKIFYKILFQYMKSSLDKADVIIAVSEYTKRDIERIFEISDIRVIYNGIDTDVFRPSIVEDPYPDKVKLLFVGNLIKRKGVDLLPKIMKKLDDRFILFYTSGLRTRDDILSNSRMIPLGRPSLDKLVTIYNMCDILVSPSRLEGFGYSVAEAMSCGKPVVATNCSSLPELVDDGKGGFLCNIDDHSDFADKIEVLGEDECVRKRMGTYNRNKTINKFSLYKMGQEYERLYRKIL